MTDLDDFWIGFALSLLLIAALWIIGLAVIVAVG